MECGDIQERLSGYIEGIISREEKVLIDEHLRRCPKCKESLADLKKTVEYVQKLEEIEPPTWLTQKVMQRVTAEADQKKGILRKLFYPLHIKVPIEAVAVILIGVTSIYIFKSIQPDMQLAKAPSREITPGILLREKAKPSAVEEGKSGPTRSADQLMFAKEQEPPEVPKAPAKVAKRDEGVPRAGAVAKDESERKGLPSESRATAIIEREEGGIRFTIYVKDIEAANKEIERTLIHLGGTILKIRTSEKKHVIEVELDSDKVAELMSALKLIGQVKERMEDLEVPEGNIRIELEVTKILSRR